MRSPGRSSPCRELLALNVTTASALVTSTDVVLIVRLSRTGSPIVNRCAVVQRRRQRPPPVSPGPRSRPRPTRPLPADSSASGSTTSWSTTHFPQSHAIPTPDDSEPAEVPSPPPPDYTRATPRHHGPVGWTPRPHPTTAQVPHGPCAHPLAPRACRANSPGRRPLGPERDRLLSAQRVRGLVGHMVTHQGAASARVRRRPPWPVSPHTAGARRVAIRRRRVPAWRLPCHSGWQRARGRPWQPSRRRHC